MRLLGVYLADFWKVIILESEKKWVSKSKKCMIYCPLAARLVIREPLEKLNPNDSYIHWIGLLLVANKKQIRRALCMAWKNTHSFMSRKYVALPITLKSSALYKCVPSIKKVKCASEQVSESKRA